ncbi:MAG: nucleotidyl transferase AbiEii/AbiGii toxin family protein [Eubacteriales bacterium]|nr:nucleotidyl transferase AbiEii/AbiGii toxin family protein [Eubacteriales bacterium]
MAIINDMIQTAIDEGYSEENAEAYVCQNLVLLALSRSSLSRTATIKGGVVMRSLSGSARRATQDMDIDFIRYSLSDTAIATFVERLNCIPDIIFEQMGIPEELKQQDYHGKRIYVRISDSSGDMIESKIDLGVHKNLTIEQEEYCFDIAGYDEGASLLINSKEQMFTEKLRSLLKFGSNSTRYKDIFDLCYLSTLVDSEKLMDCLETFIFSDPGMKENNMVDIRRRVAKTFSDSRYKSRLERSRKNWLEKTTEDVLLEITDFLKNF